MSEEKQAPAWINKQFIQKILRNVKKDNSITVNNIVISPAASKGDHYATIMFRVVADYQKLMSYRGQSISLIIKTMPDQTDSGREFFNESSVFDTEVAMYRDTLSKFEELLQKAGDNTKFRARMLYYSLSPRPVIIFEDLATRGYSIIRHRMMELDEVKAVFTKLAKWHAISYKLALEQDPVVTKYKTSSIDLPGFKESEFVSKGIELFRTMVETLKGYEKYVPLLKELEQDLINRVVEVHRAAKSGKPGIFVLNHGDFHFKNIMMRLLDDGTTDDVLLIDFQLSFYGPPSIDLITALYMVGSDDVRENHRDEVIFHYSSVFIETLKKLDFTGPMPTIGDFHEQLYKDRIFETYMFTTIYPMRPAFINPQEYDIPRIIERTDYRKQMFYKPEVVEKVMTMLPKLLHKGYLE